MATLTMVNFDEWKLIPEDKKELQVSSESIYWKKLDRTELCEVSKNYELANIQDFLHVFNVRIDEIKNLSKANRLIIRFWWVGNDPQNFISIYPEQRVGSNSRYGLVFHQYVNGKKSPNSYYTTKTFAVGEAYKIVVSRSEASCGFMVSSMNNPDPIESYENPQWDLMPYDKISFARHDNDYKADLKDWSSGQIWSVEIEQTSQAKEQNTTKSANDELNDAEASLKGTFQVKERLMGLTPRIASDASTANDALGYDAYAQAIYRFITHKETTSPLTISIQAPWGGGKTCLMKMIQSRLDPVFYNKIHNRQVKKTGSLTLGDAFEFIKKNKESEKIPIINTENHRLTVWFNAWKYSSTEQVWAGLAHSIISQIPDHYSNELDKQKFWLTLNLRRINRLKIQSQISTQILSKVIQKMQYHIVSLGLILLAIPMFLYDTYQSLKLLYPLTGNLSPFLSLTGGGYYLWKTYNEKVKEVKKEPAAFSLGDYIKVPNYEEKLGFIHHVVEDMNHVFNSIPDNLPIVIFIDDLDRCSPDNISKVLEGINLFLAGEFPNCIFIMGMDTEIVAAAMDEAHENIFQHLPIDAKDTPIGWKFMDKFVQLPFMIPPVMVKDVERYAKSLLSERKNEKDQDVKEAERLLQNIHDPEQIQTEVNRIRNESNFDERKTLLIQEVADQRIKLEVINQKIDEFSDDESNIRKFTIEAAPSFSNNPREVKRFINMFRFLSFLKISKDNDPRHPPSLDQIKRWIIFSLKWPEAARWIRRKGYCLNEKIVNDSNISKKKLQALEELSKKYSQRTKWKNYIEDNLRLDLKNCKWIDDSALAEFFINESEEPEKLSDAAGLGLW